MHRASPHHDVHFVCTEHRHTMMRFTTRYAPYVKASPPQKHVTGRVRLLQVDSDIIAEADRIDHDHGLEDSAVADLVRFETFKRKRAQYCTWAGAGSGRQEARRNDTYSTHDDVLFSFDVEKWPRHDCGWESSSTSSKCRPNSKFCCVHVFPFAAAKRPTERK